MRRRLPASLALAVLSAAAAWAQQFTHVWRWVAPDDEEFGVLMPEPHYRIRRELPFGGGLVLKPASFEITNRGNLYSVLSFSKSAPSMPKTFDEFLRGFGRALEANAGGAQVSLTFERDLKLEGRAGKRFAVKAGEARGSARAYETAEHFYVVLTLGAAAVGPSAERFQESFSFNRGGPSRVPEQETVGLIEQPIKPPAPLWPVAGGTTVIGVRGQGDAGPPQERAASGGVLAGKILSRAAPTYPPIAKAARAQGAVVVQIIVDEEGYVIAASAVSGHPLLQQSASHAVRQWRFTPTLLEGKPVKVTGTVTVNYALN